VSGRFEVADTPLAGLMVITRQPIADERGWLERMFCTIDLAEVLGSRSVAQVNRTLTRAAGTVRGLHYQLPPSAEAKLVSCLRGAIFDVAVDVRRGSSTFLRWHAETLDAGNRRSLFIPEGFAHGVQALTDDAEILYLTTAAYDPGAERGVHPLEPRVGVAWPLPVAHLSERDAAHPALTPGFEGIDL
jgi:dTDP-4-dehydrorhamnose 3,5-epimerase